MCYAVCILMLFVFSLPVGSNLSPSHRVNVRLINGNRTKDLYSGILQLYIKEKKWVFGCGGILENAIHAVCRELEYDSGRALPPNIFGHQYHFGSKMYTLDCSSEAENTSQCSKSVSSRCIEHAGVGCWNKGVEPKNTVELEKLYGLEIFGAVKFNVYGMSGYACPKNMNDQNAAVFCRALNFMGGYVAFSRSDPRYEHVKYVTFTLVCDKTSTDFLECPMIGTSCSSRNRVATVYCYRQKRHMIIVNRRDNKIKGEVRLKIGSKWGRVCMPDEPQKSLVAEIVCRQMGYKGGIPASPVPSSNETHMWFSGLFCRRDDTSIFGCNFTSLEATDEKCLASPLHVICFERSVLIGRGYDSSGTVRVYVFNVRRYRFVCLEGFSDIEATAICRGNGYKYGKTVKGSNAGVHPVDGIVVERMKCPKTASSITDCRYAVGPCWSKQYVSVACSHIPYPERGNYTLDLSNKSKGLVMLTHFNQTGFICGDGFDDAAATVVCREIDPAFDTGIAFRSNETERYRRLVWLRDLNCIGNEWTISACNHSTWGDATGCGHFVAGVTCYSMNKIRLINGNQTKDAYSGILQLYNKEKLKWVFGCERISENAIRVICRESGYDSGRALRPNIFGYHLHFGSKMYTLDCSKDAATTSQCNLTGSPTCFDHAGIGCWNKGSQLKKMVELETLYGTENFGAVRLNIYGMRGYACPKYMGDLNAAVFCRALNFTGGYVAFARSDPRYERVKYVTPTLLCEKSSSDFLECPMIGTSCSSRTKVVTVYCYRQKRHMVIVNGVDNKTKGEVRLKIGNKWGRVCMPDEPQKSLVAEIVCRQMGYAHGIAAKPVPSGGEEHMWFSGLFCRRDDTSIFGCNFTSLEATDKNCLASPLNVNCFKRVLIGRVYDSSGTVRVYVVNVRRYRFVCLEGFSDIEATAICRGNGYKYGMAVKGSDAGIKPLDGIVVDRMKCPKTASSITDCRYAVGPCWSKQYVSVACSHLPYPERGNYTLDLSNKSHGLVMLTHFNNTGFICGDGFDNAAATVVCREIDATFDTGIAFRSNETERYRRLVWLRDLNCTGNEWTISACNHSKLGDATGCGDFVAGVTCYSMNKSTSRTGETPNTTESMVATSTKALPRASSSASTTILHTNSMTLSVSSRTRASRETMSSKAFRNGDRVAHFLAFINIISVNIISLSQCTERH